MIGTTPFKLLSDQEQERDPAVRIRINPVPFIEGRVRQPVPIVDPVWPIGDFIQP